MELPKPKTSWKTSCFFLNDAMFRRFLWKNIDVDVFDDVLQNAKHRANDASNDVNRPPLGWTSAVLYLHIPFPFTVLSMDIETCLPTTENTETIFATSLGLLPLLTRCPLHPIEKQWTEIKYRKLNWKYRYCATANQMFSLAPYWRSRTSTWNCTLCTYLKI